MEEIEKLVGIYKITINSTVYDLTFLNGNKEGDIDGIENKLYEKWEKLL